MQAIFPTYNYVAITAENTLTVKKLNIFQWIVRRLFGCYKETHSGKINALLEKEVKFLNKELTKDEAFLLLVKKIDKFQGIYTYLTKKGILSDKPGKLVYEKVQRVTSQNMTKTDSDSYEVFPLSFLNYFPENGRFGPDGIFGDGYKESLGFMELDPSHVLVKGNEYSTDQGKTWQNPGQHIPHDSTLVFRKIDFKQERKSYGDYELTPSGLPLYPLRHLKLGNQHLEEKYLKFRLLGPNPSTDQAFFRIGPSGNLEVAAERGDMMQLKFTPVNEKGQEEVIFEGIDLADTRNGLHAWRETRVTAHLIDSQEGADWKSITVDKVRDWANGTGKFFGIQSEFVMLALLNPTFQKRVVSRIKEQPAALKQVFAAFAEAARQADKLGIQR